MKIVRNPIDKLYSVTDNTEEDETMNKLQRDILRRYHVNLVQDLEPKHVLDRLYQDGILTDNDLELIQAEKSVRGRCQVLLSMLPTRGPSAYGSFQRALREASYSHLGEIFDRIGEKESVKKSVNEKDVANDNVIESSDDKIETNNNKLTICENCKGFLEAKLVPVNKDAVILKVLKKNVCLLMHNIEPRDLIDEFYQSLLLNDDQCERIRVSKTRRDRCEVFFGEMIKIKGESGRVLSVLLKSLKKKYSYIVDELELDAMKKKPNFCTQRKDQIQVIRKLQQIESDTNVMKPAKLDETTTKKKDYLENISVKDQLTGDNTKCKVNGSKETDPKEMIVADDIKISGMRQSPDVVKSYALKDDTKHSDKDCDEIHQAHGVVNITLEDISSPLLKEFEVKFTADSNDSFDIPDGIVILRSAGTLNNETLHPNACKNRIGEKKGKSKQSVSTRKSPNRNNAKHKVTVSQKEESFRPLVPDTVGSNENKATETNETNESQHSLQITTLGNSTPNEPSKRLSFAFNHLSTLINEGNFEKFDILSHRLKERFPTDYDMQCIVGYLKTSRDLFMTNFDSAKQNINSTMELVPKTSNPRYFTLELFTAKTRMYITQKKLEKLQSTLDDVMMILETDPVGCTGRAAGWLYINDARNQTAKLSVLNLSKPNALKVYEQLFERAKTSFKRSMTNFKNDGGKDGPFGFGYALCRLVILLLRCGDNGMTMNSLNPPPEDIDAAEQYLKNLEDSEIAMAKILDMHYRLAKCDYYFRRENSVRALENAEMAYSLASELQLLEFTEHAHNRLKFLQSRSKLKVKELSDDEVDKILFGDSAESMGSHSD